MRWSILAAAILLLAIGSTSDAAPITFDALDAGVGPGGARPNSDAAAAAFDLAADNLGLIGLIDFEGLAIGDFGTMVVAPGVTVTLSGTAASADAGITGTAGSATLGYNTTATGANHLRVVPVFDVGTCSATFDFDRPTEFFGAYLTGLGTANGNLHVLFEDGTNQDLSVMGTGSGGVKFFGFTDAGKSISQVTLELQGVQGSRDIFGIDDVRYEIPEPSTFAMMALAGLLGGLAYRRRRNRS